MSSAAPPSPLAAPGPWDLVSSAYATEVVPTFEPFAREALRLAAPPSGSRIVDVACGPGTLAALASGHGLRVDALDFSPRMIQQLVARSLPGVTAHTGDGQALPFADGTFAAGFSLFGLMFFPDRARGFAELRRVLQSGARAVVSSWPPVESAPVLAPMFAALRTEMGVLLGGQAPPERVEMPLSSEEACRAEMGAAFAGVEVHRFATTQRAPSADALWESIARTMAPIVLMQKMLGEERWAGPARAARQAIVDVVGSGPVEMELTALVSVGVAG